MGYTAKEEDELNQELAAWQKKQLRAVGGKNIDYAFEKMSDADRQIWKIIATAKSHKDVNWLVWSLAEDVVEKYARLARKSLKE